MIKYTYLLVDASAVIVPFLFSFHPRLRFDKNFAAFFKANVIVTLCFLVWDAVFTSIGVWWFNDRYLLGIRFQGLPIEEMLFFVCIPFACVFTWHCFNLFVKVKWSPGFDKSFVLGLSAVILVIGGMNYFRLYTGVTFIVVGVLLVLAKFFFKVKWLPAFFVCYAVLMVPFFLVNGVLTGTGLEEAVVNYNDAENLGIRLGTIPVEDVVYGVGMIGGNIFFYERFMLATRASHAEGHGEGK